MAQRPPPLQAKLPRPADTPENPSPPSAVNYTNTQPVPFAMPQNQTVPQPGTYQGPPVKRYIKPGTSGLVPSQSQPVSVPESGLVISPSPGPQVVPSMPPSQVPVTKRPIHTTPVVNSRPMATPVSRLNPPVTVPPIQTGSQPSKTLQQRASQTISKSSRPGTPPAPPFSPILPPMSKDEADKIASLLSNMDPYNAPRVIGKQPSSIPISESENTDVIALRAALSVLQMQKQTAARDIRSLEEMRDLALQDPDGYVRALLTRVNATSGQKDAGLLDETLKFAVEGLWVKGVEDGSEHLASAVKDSKASGDVDMDDASEESESDDSSESDDEEKEKKKEKKPKKKEKFKVPPKPQNVVRMPPVNWSKYQVVGESLDRLHESQRRKPTPGIPAIDVDADDEGDSQEPYVLAAPYQPFLDQERMKQSSGVDGWSANVGPSGDHPMQTRRAARRHIG